MMIRSYKTLECINEDGIAVVSINRPQVLNALNGQVFKEIRDIFEELGQDETVRVVILTGKGDKAFAAGSDVKEFADSTFLEARDISIRNNAAQQVVANCPKPTIAVLNGYALGGGLELAMCCDIRIASEKARLGQPEIGLGFIPGGGGTQRLARIIGVARAKEMCFSGEPINAQRAYEIGLVNRVVPHDQLIDTAKDMAKNFAEKSSLILTFCKEAIDRGIEMNLENGLNYETQLWAESFATEDHHEGITAFLEKRKAVFNGK